MDTKNDQQQYIDTIQQLEKKLADCKNDKSELINKYTIRLLELCPFHSQSLPANRMTTDFSGGVTDWVFNRFDKIISDPDRVKRLLTEIPSAPDTDKGLQFWNLLKRHPDLIQAAKYPGLSGDIIEALVFRYLIENIFSKPFFQIDDHLFNIIQRLEDNMTLLKPLRSWRSIRNWKIETYNNIMADPNFPKARNAYRRMLANEMADIFSFLIPDETKEHISQTIENAILKPAMDFKERIVLNEHEYQVELNKYLNTSQTKTKFLDKLVREYTDFQDVLTKMKTSTTYINTFRSHQMDTTPLHITPVCAIQPALIMYNDNEKGVNIKTNNINHYVRQTNAYILADPVDKNVLLDAPRQELLDLIVEYWSWVE